MASPDRSRPDPADDKGWQQLTERGSPVLIRLIRWIALHLGRPAARLLLYPITAYFLLAAPTPRRASREYLQRLSGRPAGWLDAARHIHCFAATILDRVFLLTDRTGMLDIRVHGAELLDARMAGGRGCVLMGSHLGSFEVLRAVAINQRGLAVKVLMQPEHNQTLTQVLHALNPAIAESVIPLGGIHALMQAHEALDRGELLGMLGDRTAAGAPRVPCDFLGHPADFPLGPWQAAAVFKAPVLLFFGIYHGGNRYDIHFELLTERLDLPRRGRDQALEAWVQRYADRLSHHARLAPNNWFNFYPFWTPQA